MKFGKSLLLISFLAIFALLAAGMVACEKKPAPSFGEAVKLAAKTKNLKDGFKIINQSLKWSKQEKSLKGEFPSSKIDAANDFLRLKMTDQLLTESFQAGSQFLVKWQKPEGNFGYMYDWLDKTWVEDDNQVRQAGSLWGVALCHKYKPTPETRAALDKGLKFWFDRTIEGPGEGTLAMKYMEDPTIMSGSVALVGLSIIEYLTTEGEQFTDEYKKELTDKLTGYLNFLKWLQLENGHFSKEYKHGANKPTNRTSPYFDGETLLCLCKAARLLDYKDLVPVIERAAEATAMTYTIKAWAKNKDSDQTKGFYQWSSMAFAEYYQAKWKNYELYGDITLALGWWMTHIHKTLKMGRNHAYAIEGLISAYRIAQWKGDTAAMIDLLYTIDRSLEKLTTWQIGGPLAKNNQFLVENPTDDPMALGGVMNAKKKSIRPVQQDVAHQLRIDVTQHQMHAVTMALDYIYK